MTPEKRGKPLQVLETHTVSGVTSHTYSVSSSHEGTRANATQPKTRSNRAMKIIGTWTVTFIADKYCRYPTNPPDSTLEAA